MFVHQISTIFFIVSCATLIFSSLSSLSIYLLCEFKLLKIKLYKSYEDVDDSTVVAAGGGGVASTFPPVADVDVPFNETKKSRLSLATIGVLRWCLSYASKCQKTLSRSNSTSMYQEMKSRPHNGTRPVRAVALRVM